MNKLCENCPNNGPYGCIISPCEYCPNNDFMINGTIPIVQPLRETTDHITNKTYTTTTTDYKIITVNNNGLNAGDAFVTGLTTDLPTADEYREFIGAPYYYYQREWSEPKYICPKCGGGMCKHENIVFCSNPPRYEYKCNECDYIEYQLG